MLEFEGALAPLAKVPSLRSKGPDPVATVSILHPSSEAKAPCEAMRPDSPCERSERTPTFRRRWHLALGHTPRATRNELDRLAEIGRLRILSRFA